MKTRIYAAPAVKGLIIVHIHVAPDFNNLFDLDHHSLRMTELTLISISTLI